MNKSIRIRFYRTQDVWAYFRKDHEPEISIVIQEQDAVLDNGCLGEMSLRRCAAANALRLECFEDAWAWLPFVTPLLLRFHKQNPTIEEMCEEFRRWGWIDDTARMAAESSNPVTSDA